MDATDNHFSRRQMMRAAVLAGLAVALPVDAFAARRKAQASVAAEPYVPHQTAFASASVDTSGLANRGLPNYAARIARETAPVVHDVFADRLTGGRPGAPRVIVRIDTIELGNADANNFGLFGSGNPDSVSGAAVVVDGAGRVVFEKPLWTSIPAAPTNGDLLYSEDLRARRLVETLARWVKQDV